MTNEIWKDIKDAARHYNYSQSAISECCRGTRRKIYNYIWRYL